MELPYEWRYEFLEGYGYIEFLESSRGLIRGSLRAAIFDIIVEFKATDKKLQHEAGRDWTHHIGPVRDLTTSPRWQKLCRAAKAARIDIDEHGWTTPEYE